jgi:hypothetical protein
MESSRDVYVYMMYEREVLLLQRIVTDELMASVTRNSSF